MGREMPMATFIRDYASVLDSIEGSGDEIVLERRAGRASFLLSPLSRAEGDRHAVDAVAHVLRQALEHGELEQAIKASLLAEYPWVIFLPDEEARRFGSELMDTLRACAAIGRFSAFDALVQSWSATAEIYSDPQLAALLTAPVAEPDGSDVSEPAFEHAAEVTAG